MKNKNIISSILAIALLMALGLACNQYGTKLEFNGGELYYTSSVNVSDAQKLGKYLVDENFYDGQPKTVQLDRNGPVYQFRMVVQKEKQTDESTIEAMKAFGSELSSSVFNDAPVEMHICDDELKTLRVVTP